MREVEIPNWLKGLPLAPEFRPTDTEFADPIAYISKIEKEASAFGICKVIPPLPKPSKKYVVTNLNKSLSKSPELGSDVNLSNVRSSSKKDDEDKGNDGVVQAVFTTRHQELGQAAKRTKGSGHPQPSAVHKQVWQSGEIYTLEQFESKSKSFARSQLGMVKELSPFVIEALFWRASTDKPIYVEYANDVPGSGFGEPEGLFRYFKRRRRRRTFDRYSRGSSDGNKHQVDIMSNSGENKDESPKTGPNSSVEMSKASTSSLTMSSDQKSRCSRQKTSNASNEMEGTAGWKLTNSPWNLQVIARAPGSLTRFMPDDIPGVTSPMVYIGMLFSWFAWHVEDHELHSMNFLHTGSPKAWYAVPGDYAFAFEEVIRTQAYGGTIDRLAALTLLGEKTTLLSPEVVVASGIPCCRLIQNPGEYVVTFPRAYHVGFSHGFNCGEAANFGTPRWLSVAKDAAVRRAAMNYLPMLSHQQLLYLLTMSFVSRVPRSLLPGVRSSRLRDRQKEERELLVKKAFIEDILNENNLLTCLLGKNSSYHVVLWDLESLPSPSKDSELSGSIPTADTTPKENVFSENDSNQDLFSQMSLYMETVNDLYVNDDDDDLSSDFQIDSGTLACVACGVLGFPFMSVVQPSEMASMDLLPADHHMVQDVGVSEPVESLSPSDPNSMVEGSASDGLSDQDSLKCKVSPAFQKNMPTVEAPKSGKEFKLTKDGERSSIDAKSSSLDATAKTKPNESNLLDHPNVESSQSMLCFADDVHLASVISPPSKDLPVSLKATFTKGWSISRGFIKPRIFCLEHAIQIEELLHSRGGANVLVICHSDFQKIKAHAAAITEEIGSPFNYNEIPLDNASQEDLNLINLAIDDEEQDGCGEDWTSKLNINLRHCVKIRKNSPSMQVQHALTLSGLSSDTSPSSDALYLKWRSRKSRSKRNLNHPVYIKPSDSVQMEKDEVLGANSDGNMVRKVDKIIQYYRRSFKSKRDDFAQARQASGDPMKHPLEEVLAVDCGDSNKKSRSTSENISNNENTGNSSPGLDVLASIGKSVLQHESQLLGTTWDEYSVPSQKADLIDTATPVVENVESQIQTHTSKEMIMEGKDVDSTWDGAEMQPKLRVTERGNEKNERWNAESFAGSLAAVHSIEICEMQRENQIMEKISMTNEGYDLVTMDCSEGQCHIQSDMDILVEASGPAKSVVSCADEPVMGSCDAHVEKTVEKFCMNSDTYDCVTQDDKVQREIRTTNGSNEKELVSGNVKLRNQSTTVTMAESLEVPREVNAAKEMHTGDENCSLPDKRWPEQTNSMKICMKNEVFACVTSDDNVQQEIESTNESDVRELISSNVTLINKPTSVLTRESSEVRIDTHATEEMQSGGENCSLLNDGELENDESDTVQPRSSGKKVSKRKRKMELQTDQFDFSGFIRSPCEGLRPRAGKDDTRNGYDSNKMVEEKLARKKVRKCSDDSVSCKGKKENIKGNTMGSYKCDLEDCSMSFRTKADLRLHKHNRCPYKGCGKKFSSHNSAMLHQRLHEKDRPLKCPWKGCTMSFKWAWARTEHLRVHTGERPYQCKVEGCGLTFRFISDFSRHRRKTGHYVKLPT
ncbi:lysine-specific demethylase ELF6 [Cornus florida]|uniref:lysine-specific demethylase ELF6 n=1 Tax=Cornus florida TaxID=4283 RepID=UPI00289883D2|nr:lysine-specific demethylase ELF6 [Cornus florida]